MEINLHFQSKDGRLGWDFEQDVQANMYDSTVKGNRDADIRYGTDVQADFSGIKTRDMYDMARRENPLLPNTGIQDVDMAINTTEEKLRQEQNRGRIKWLLSKLGRL
jgi:hypothetical protein